MDRLRAEGVEQQQCPNAVMRTVAENRRKRVGYDSRLGVVHLDCDGTPRRSQIPPEDGIGPSPFSKYSTRFPPSICVPVCNSSVRSKLAIGHHRRANRVAYSERL